MAITVSTPLNENLTKLPQFPNQAPLLIYSPTGRINQQFPSPRDFIWHGLAPPVAHQATPPIPETTIVCEPGKLPYVLGGIPGTWQLTNEMMEQVLEEEDAAMMKGKMIDPC
jgi:hypothetical protein